MEQEGYVTPEAVAQYFGVKVSTIHDWRKSIGLPSHRFGHGRRGGTVRFKWSEIYAREQKQSQKDNYGQARFSQRSRKSFGL